MGDINEIKELQRKRFEFLKRLYELSKGDIYFEGSMFIIGQELDLDEQSTIKVTDYLSGEGLLKYTASGGHIGITHRGIKEVEKALSHPDRKTEHSPPIKVIQVGTMINSQIQQDSPGATQVQTIDADERAKLEGIIQSLKEQINELELNPQERDDLEVDISTMETQMRSSSPKKSIIIEALKAILTGATGSLFASGLVQQISTWIGG